MAFEWVIYSCPCDHSQEQRSHRKVVGECSRDPAQRMTQPSKLTENTFDNFEAILSHQ